MIGNYLRSPKVLEAMANLNDEQMEKFIMAASRYYFFAKKSKEINQSFAKIYVE